MFPKDMFATHKRTNALQYTNSYPIPINNRLDTYEEMERWLKADPLAPPKVPLKRRLLRLFGKKYSSDVTGDGPPKPSITNKKRAKPRVPKPNPAKQKKKQRRPKPLVLAQTQQPKKKTQVKNRNPNPQPTRSLVFKGKSSKFHTEMSTLQEIHQERAPVAIGTHVARSVPHVETHADGSVTITHRELAQQINFPAVVSSNYIVQRYPVNPAINTLFPYLSAIASRFANYEFHDLELLYVSHDQTSDQGYVDIGFQPDVDEPAPITPSMLTSYQGAVESNVWMNSFFKCPVGDLHKKNDWWVRKINSADDPSAAKFYDIGNIMVGCDNQNVDVAGNLFVSYKITLSNEVLPNITLVDCGGKMTEIVNADKTDPFRDVVFDAGTQNVTTWTNPDTGKVNVLVEKFGAFLFEIFYSGTGVLAGSSNLTVGTKNSPTSGWDQSVYNIVTNGTISQIITYLMKPNTNSPGVLELAMDYAVTTFDGFIGTIMEAPYLLLGGILADELLIDSYHRKLMFSTTSMRALRRMKQQRNRFVNSFVQDTRESDALDYIQINEDDDTEQIIPTKSGPFNHLRTGLKYLL